MNKQQYNNVINYTLKHDEVAQGDDSLATARAVFNNMGVALPNGTMKEVYDTIQTDDYMGWHSCTMQEAQEAANNGIAAIGISEDRIVILSAADEEQSVARTTSVMVIDETTPAMAVAGMRYYAYTCGTTRVFTANFIIRQMDKTILYPDDEQPGTEKRAFYDSKFYTAVCNKPSATGTIAGNGCAICSLAMYLLYKSNRTNTNANTYNAVKEATIKGTHENIALKGNSFSLSYGGIIANVSAADTSVTAAKLDAALNNNMCIVKISTKHYVLVYGVDSSASGTDKYLVADPGSNSCYTLTQSLAKYELGASLKNISSMRIIE